MVVTLKQVVEFKTIESESSANQLLSSIMKYLGPSIYNEENNKINIENKESIDFIYTAFVIKKLNITDNNSNKSKFNSFISLFKENRNVYIRSILFYYLTLIFSKENIFLDTQESVFSTRFIFEDSKNIEKNFGMMYLIIFRLKNYIFIQNNDIGKFKKYSDYSLIVKRSRILNKYISLKSIQKNSPLEISLIISGIAALASVITLILHIIDRKAMNRKTNLEIECSELEKHKLQIEIALLDRELKKVPQNAEPSMDELIENELDSYEQLILKEIQMEKVEK